MFPGSAEVGYGIVATNDPLLEPTATSRERYSFTSLRVEKAAVVQERADRVEKAGEPAGLACDNAAVRTRGLQAVIHDAANRRTLSQTRSIGKPVALASGLQMHRMEDHSHLRRD